MPRQRKSLRIISLSVGVMVAVAATVGIAIYVANRASRSTQPDCLAGHHGNHQVVVQHGQVTPRHTTAPKCDTVTITNLDDTTRLMAFGVHEDHQSYDGIGEKLLSRGQSLKVTLVKTGNYKFHDHVHDEVQGTFTVKPN